MKANKKIVQLSLVSIGLFLILATYFFYPKFLKEKAIKDSLAETEVTNNKERNTFENVEYIGLYDVNRPFKVKAKKAYILDDDPNVIYMMEMQVTLHASDGRVIVITSDEGSYNKVTYDCFFKNNVNATDGETIILSENLDLLSTNETASVYNDVVLTNETGSLQADKVDYNFETKYYKISMYDNTRVKVKLIK